MRTAESHAWANSLFEDNAEYGYGMVMADKQLRGRIEETMRELLELDVDDALKTAMTEWIEYKNDGAETRAKSENVLAAIENLKTDNEEVKALCSTIVDLKDHLVKKSIWALGGDGWAYDIGYGGLDHVLASGENINILGIRYRSILKYRRTGFEVDT